jgi:hypothetical protein
MAVTHCACQQSGCLFCQIFRTKYFGWKCDFGWKYQHFGRKSKKDFGWKSENQGVADKILNGSGLTKFSQICGRSKVLTLSSTVTLSSKVFCSKDRAFGCRCLETRGPTLGPDDCLQYQTGTSGTIKRWKKIWKWRLLRLVHITSVAR